VLVNSQGYCTPKRGNVASEYEDAYFPESACNQHELSEFRCAVADGASDSAFSREWARLLVRRYHRPRLSLDFLQRFWLQKVTRKPVPWYLEEKIRRGAYATFVGLSIHDPEPEESCGSWKATAVGDSCLFHVREDELLTVAPLVKSDEFNNHPHLVSTDSSTSFGLNESRIKIVSGEWLAKDVFYLLTDALAEWTLAEHEAGRPPWSLFSSLGSDSDSDEERQRCFETLVANLRETGGLHNDDVTLLRIEVN
jgi:serine/threonine protein phosphatase PrpC